jgi:hypothetical protein
MFRGIIDEVRIWNTARTQAQIAQNKNSVSSVLGNQALVAYYQFDEGSGGVTGDSAHGYVGGLSNGPVWVTSSAPIIAPPDVYIGGQLPDNITGTSAQLHGIVHPHLEPASAWFEYGTNTSFGNMTSPTNLPAVNSFVPISSVISGLSLSTTNYYRVVALNHDGTT